MSKTLVMVNPYAASGRTLHAWARSAPLLKPHFESLRVIVTRQRDAIAGHLTEAYADDIRQVIGVGGDGTNFALLNALIPFNDRQTIVTPGSLPLTYGMLPVGTGCDWARSRGIPREPSQAAKWLLQAKPRAVDVGHLRINGADERYFLNIASTGLGGEVDARVSKVTDRRPWTFLRATISAILTYSPQRVSVTLDGETWFTRETLLVVVANGTTFGHGMKIAPDAHPDDGLFDVIVLSAVSKPRLLAALGRVYTGSHLTHPAIGYRRAKSVVIESHDGPLAIDLDGEYLRGHHLDFTVKPGLLAMRG